MLPLIENWDAADGISWKEAFVISMRPYCAVLDLPTCIEKGSVFVVKLDELPTLSQLPSYVGNYKNEGFGKVIYGWNLLQKAGENGQTALQLTHKTKAQATETRALEGTPLLAFLARKKHKNSSSVFIYEVMLPPA